MRANLRITAEFDSVIATQTETSGLTQATIVDDAAGLLHNVVVEYEQDEDGATYRRLNYEMVSMAGMRRVLFVTNRAAQELLYKIATSLTGSTLATFDPEKNAYVNRNFDKGMLILGPNDGVWDDVLPGDEIEAPLDDEVVEGEEDE